MQLTYSRTLDLTLRPDVLVCGAGCARRLLDRIAGDASPPAAELLPVRLVVRDSTAPPAS